MLSTLNIIEPCSCHKPCLANSKTLDNGKRKSCGFIPGILRIHPSVSTTIHQCTVTVFLLHNIEITWDYSESMWILHLHRTPSDTIGLCCLQNPDFVECTYAIICWRWTYQCQLKIGTLPVACWSFRLGDETTWNNSLKSPLQRLWGEREAKLEMYTRPMILTRCVLARYLSILKCDSNSKEALGEDWLEIWSTASKRNDEWGLWPSIERVV